MDITWFDCGDLVKIITTESVLCGEILKMDAENILLRKADGLKAVINLSKFVSAEQISNLDDPTTSSESCVEKATPVSTVKTIDTYYSETVAKSSAFPKGKKWTFEDMKSYKGLKENGFFNHHASFAAICNSLDFAFRSDKTAIDEKISNNIPKLKKIFEETSDYSVAEMIAFLYTQYTQKVRDDGQSQFKFGYSFLAKHCPYNVAISYVLANATLLDVLELTLEFDDSVDALVCAIASMNYKRNKYDNDDILSQLSNKIYGTQMSIKDKNLIFYAVAQATGVETSSLATLDSDSSNLLDSLYDLIEWDLGNYTGCGIVVDVADGKIIDTDFLRVVYFAYPVEEQIRVGNEVIFDYNAKTDSAKISNLVHNDDIQNIKSLILKLKNKTDDPKLQEIRVFLETFLASAKSGPLKNGTAGANTNYTVVSNNEYTRSASATTAGKDRRYSQITVRIQNAKTYDECILMKGELEDYIEKGRKNKLNAIKDLISLCVRKTVADHDEAIRIFEKYKDLFTDRTELLKLYKLIIPTYITIEKYEEAITLLNEVLAVQTSVQDYTKMAYCYLQQEKHKLVLDYCKKAIRCEKISVADFATIYTYQFAAYIALHKISDAERVLIQYSKRIGSTTEKIKNMEEIISREKSGESIDDGNSEQMKINELIDSIDFREMEVGQFILSELYSSYFKTILDASDYPAIHNKQFDRSLQKMIWIPKSAKDAKKTHESLMVNSLRVIREGTIRTGVLDEVAEKHLTMAKIAEYCLSHILDLGIDDLQTNQWKDYFIWSSAEYMWTLYRKYSLTRAAQTDTRIFYLLESLCLFFKDENYKLRYEFFDSLNKIIICQPGLQQDFSEIPLRSYDELNRRHAGEEQVNGEIASMEQIIAQNFSTALKFDAVQAITSLGMIISHCDSISAISYLVNIFSNEEDAVCRALQMYLGIQAEDSSFETLLTQYAKRTKTAQRNIELSFKDIGRIISSKDLSSLGTYIERTENALQGLELMGFSRADKERALELLNHVREFLSLRTDANQNYELIQSRVATLKDILKRLEAEYLVHPTKLTFLELDTLRKALLEQIDAFLENVTNDSLPEISLVNDYEKEGYYPQNEKIDLMLSITNGKSGRPCTPARNLELDIIPNDELRRYCSCAETHFDLVSSLAGGESKEQKIPLQLTLEGCLPDTVFELHVRVTYLTIKGTPASVEQSLNIRIQSNNAFVEIPNLYGVDEIKPDTSKATLFKGRENDISTICNMLLSGSRGKTVLIYGQYRSGKSSLASFVFEQLKNSNPALIDAPIADVIDGENSWLVIRKIIKGIIRNLKTKLGKTALPEELVCYEYHANTIDSENCHQVFDDFVQELKYFLNEKNIHLVIKLDEFGRLYRSGSATTFMQIWKSVMAQEVFDAILIGHDIITKMIMQDANPFGIVDLHQINYLSKDATKQLIQDPTRMPNGNSRFTANAVDYIWYLSAGNVFYTQLICQAAINFMNKRHINIVNELYVRQAIEEWLTGHSDEAYKGWGHPLFDSGVMIGTEEISSDKEWAKVVLDAISNVRSGNIETLTTYITSKYNLCSKKINETLYDLRARRVIDQDDKGEFSIRSKFYSDFLNAFIIRSVNTKILEGEQ